MTGGWDQATWKRVESEDELRAGMTVEARPCGYCEMVERYTILAVRIGRQRALRFDGQVTFSQHHRIAPAICTGATAIAMATAIGQRRLFALVDTTPAEETTTTTRELEKVTG